MSLTGRERVERRLAAILAADVVGYSRLMGEDEEGTPVAALKAVMARRHRTRGSRSIAAVPSRRWATGCWSNSPASSTRVLLRRRHPARDGGAQPCGQPSRSRRIVFRIGINLGDIIIDE